MVYAIILAQITLVPVAAVADTVHNNVVPGRTISLYINHSSLSTFLLEVGGNLLLCTPTGILLPLASRRFGTLRGVTAVTAGLMLAIELTQGLFLAGRSFDVDDLILNTTGAVLAYALAGRFLARQAGPRLPPCRNRNGAGRTTAVLAATHRTSPCDQGTGAFLAIA